MRSINQEEVMDDLKQIYSDFLLYSDNSLSFEQAVLEALKKAYQQGFSDGISSCHY